MMMQVQAIILLLGSSFLYTRAETVSLSLDNGAGILDLLNNGITELDSMFPHEKKGGCSPKFKGETDADDDTGRCFKISVCYISGWSLKKCCPEGTVYTPPTASKPLGSCDPYAPFRCLGVSTFQQQKKACPLRLKSGIFISGPWLGC